MASQLDGLATEAQTGEVFILRPQGEHKAEPWFV